MLMTEANRILEDLLSRWHHRCKTYRVGQFQGADPVFKNVVSSRTWDSSDDLHDDAYLKRAMKAMDFAILGDKYAQGGIQDPYKAALLILARNCYTGHSVWISPRLPKDPMERGTIIMEARNQLTRRLMNAGVM
jgi:hypothetical protein